MIDSLLLKPNVHQVESEHISGHRVIFLINNSIRVVTIESTMDVVPLLLLPVQAWHKIEKKNGNN